MKVLYVQMMDLYLMLQFFKGRYHGNQKILQKYCQRRLIPLAFVALVLENELQCHGLAVRINSRDDGATSSKNLVNFCLVMLKMTGLICEHQVQHGPKNWRISLNISAYTGWIFAIFSPYESALRANDGSVPYFRICQGTLPWQPYNVAIMKVNCGLGNSSAILATLKNFD